MASTSRADPRPLSPHLQIWRFHITMAASITHRITGTALYFGSFLITAWIVALATNAVSVFIYLFAVIGAAAIFAATTWL